jgi:DNA repair protein RadC
MDNKGPMALSNAELIALVTGCPSLDSAAEMVAQAGDLRTLATMSTEELTRADGIGPASAAAVQAALELGRRLVAEDSPDRWQVRAPSDAAHVLMPKYGDKEQEHLIVLLLDTRNRIVAEKVLYIGTVNTSLVRPAEVFMDAVRRNCPSVIVAHNHPSGDPDPSPEDVALTRRLVSAGKMLEITVLDHIVIGKGRYVSLRERSLGFEEAI